MFRYGGLFGVFGFCNWLNMVTRKLSRKVVKYTYMIITAHSVQNANL